MKTKTILTIALCGLVFASCGNRNKNKQREQDNITVTEKLDNAIDETADKIKAAAHDAVNYADSLKIEAEKGEVVEDKYTGLLPGADVPGINYHLTLVHQQKNDHGVYRLEKTYLEAENGHDRIFYEYGRYSTFTGTAANAKAQYIRLTPFDNDNAHTNFLLDGDNGLTLLNDDLKMPETKLNYTLVKINK